MLIHETYSDLYYRLIKFYNASDKICHFHNTRHLSVVEVFTSLENIVDKMNCNVDMEDSVFLEWNDRIDLNFYFAMLTDFYDYVSSEDFKNMEV